MSMGLGVSRGKGWEPDRLCCHDLCCLLSLCVRPTCDEVSKGWDGRYCQRHSCCSCLYSKDRARYIPNILRRVIFSNVHSGTPTEDFLKRWIAFLIGGAVALVVELTLIPVKARTRMIESIASSLQQIKVMEQCIAVSIDTGEKIGSVAAGRQKTFERAVTKANLALGAAETFCKPLLADSAHSSFHNPFDLIS